MLRRNSRSASSKGPLRSSKASPSETLLTTSAVVKWDGLSFGESVDLRRAMSPFSLFLSSFSGVQRLRKILGYVRPGRIVAVHPPKREKKECLWAAFGGALKLGQPSRGVVT